MANFNKGDRIQVIKNGSYCGINYNIGELGTFVGNETLNKITTNVLLDNGKKVYLYTFYEGEMIRLKEGEELPKPRAEKEPESKETGWGF